MLLVKEASQSYQYGSIKHEDRVSYNHTQERNIDLSDLIEHEGSGSKDPFESSFFDGVSNFLARHGPALAKLLLILGSAAATIYNAIKASQHPNVVNGSLLGVILGLCGLIVECGFAYAWKKKGDYDLAGAQRKTVDDIFNRSSWVMIGDISLSVGEIAFGIGKIATFWIGIVQPFVAVHLVKLFYRLKGEHPEYVAEMEIIDIRADAKAAEIRNKAQALKLDLAEQKHERSLEWSSLMERQHQASKIIRSRWFKTQIKNAVRLAIGKKLLGAQLKDKMGKLPKLLRLQGPRDS